MDTIRAMATMSPMAMVMMLPTVIPTLPMLLPFPTTEDLVSDLSKKP